MYNYVENAAPFLDRELLQEKFILNTELDIGDTAVRRAEKHTLVLSELFGPPVYDTRERSVFDLNNYKGENRK